MKYEIKQGDCFWLDATGEVSSVDATWEHWEAKWTIAATIGGTVLASGSAIRTTTTGKFRIQVAPSVTAPLATGDYYLCVQVDNTTVDYRKEIAQDKLVIKPQGVTP